MGTETERVVPIENLYQMWSVKLNNPLMGTETNVIKQLTNLFFSIVS